MMQKILLKLSLLLAMLAICNFAIGATVPNGSFETPTQDPGAYTFFAYGSGENLSGDWVQSHTAAAGTVNNTNGTFGAQPSGLDGSNMGWLVNGQGIWQDLTETYQVGYTYTLTVAVAVRADMTGSPTDTLRLNLFGGRDGLSPYVAGYVDLLNQNLSTTALTDYTVTIPEVLSTDLWANQSIGIWIINTVGGDNTGYWLDNVRLTGTPAPVTYSTWNVLSGNWGDSSSWDPNTVPNGGDKDVRFNISLGAGTINVNQNVANLTLSSIIFASPTGESYAIAGSAITLHSTIADNWLILVSGGSHTIGADLILQKGTDASAIRLADGSQLALSGVLSDETDPARVNADGYGGTLGTGVLTLSGANIYTGSTTAVNCVLEVPTLGNVGSSNPLGMSDASPANLVLNNATLRYAGTAEASTDRGLTVQGNSTLQLNGSATVAGKLVGEAGSALNVNGAGTLTYGYAGTEGSDLGQLNVGINDNGSLSLQTGSTMNLSSHLCVGYLGSGHGELNVAAGADLNVDGWLVVGYSQGQNDLGATGVLNNSGTIVKNGDPLPANESNVVIGRAGNAEFNQNAGSMTDNSAGTNLGQWGNTGTLNLNGGVYSTGCIQAGYFADTAAKGTINFNGGTLQVNSASIGYARYTVGRYGGTFINPLISESGNLRIYVKELGATIDTNGTSVKIGVPIETGVVATDGGLTKIGAGTLTLSWPNTYTGPTIVKDGTLEVEIMHQFASTAANAEGNRSDASYSLGRVFEVNPDKSIQVTRLGVFDSLGDGLVGTHVVHLTDIVGETDLATYTFTSDSTGTTYNNGFRFFALPTPVSLATGRYMIWVDTLGLDDAFAQDISGFDAGTTNAIKFIGNPGDGITSFYGNPGERPTNEWDTNDADATFDFYDPSSVTNSNVLPSVTPVVLGGETGSSPKLDIQGANQTIASLADVAGATVKGVVTNSDPAMPVVLTLGASTGTTAYTGAITGNLSLVKSGGSTQSLTGPLTYTGNTTVTGGTLIVSSINNHASVIVSGGTLTSGSLRVGTLATGAASATAVPEPGTMALLALAGLVVLLFTWRRK